MKSRKSKAFLVKLITYISNTSNIEILGTSTFSESNWSPFFKKYYSEKDAMRKLVDVTLRYEKGKSRTKVEGLKWSSDPKKRNLLLVGLAKSGKSALANTLVSKDRKFENIFGEGKRLNEELSESSRWFKVNGNDYYIIDTVGSDTFDNNQQDFEFYLNECLDNIVRSSHDLNGEINQIFFVVKEGESRSNKILEIYKILKLVFGDQKPIDEYITIVFTNTNTNILENPEGCLENYRKIMKKNEKECEEVNRILNSCNKVVYIDNPPVPQSNDGAKKEAVEKDRETSKSRLVKILKEEQERSYSKGWKLNKLTKELMQMKILEKKLLSYTENESNFSTLDSVKSEKISELRKNFLQNLNKNIEQEMQLSNNHISGSEVVNEYNSSLLFALNLLGVLTKFLV